MKIDATKLLKHTVIMLSGDEDALRRRHLSELVREASAGDDFDLQTFSGDEAPPLAWFAAAGTAPFLSPRRTVVVRNVLRAEPIDVKAHRLPDTGLVLLVADDESGDESKQKRLQTLRKGWEKAVSGAGGLVLTLDADAKAFRSAVKAEAEERGKEIGERAIETLSEMCAGSLSRALEEVEKLSLFVGDQKQISEGDVKSLVIPSREWNVFKMIDAIVGGNSSQALTQLRNLLGGTVRVEEVAQSSILPLLTRQLRLLWQARLCVEARCSASAPPESVRALFPERPNLAGEKEFVQRRAMQSAQGVTLPQIGSCMQILSDTDAALKGMLPAFSPLDTLEQMVLRMIEVVRPRVRVRSA